MEKSVKVILCLFGMRRSLAERKLLEEHNSEVMNLGKCRCSCGSVVKHCVSSTKGCGFNSQGTHILTKQ